MHSDKPMTAARCAEIRKVAWVCRGTGQMADDVLDLAAMLDRAMQQIAIAWDGGTRTPEMVALLKEWGSL